MNKQIAKEKLDKIREYLGRYCNVTVMSRGLIYDLGNIINFLDDLELYEPKKVVVPQWFADWIEEQKVHFGKDQMMYRLWLTYDKVVRDMPYILTNEQWDWLQDNKELATRAILDGYIVKPKRWVVKFEQDNEQFYFNSWMHVYSTQPIGYARKEADNVIKFTDKKKAEAVAVLVEGSVEEV